MRYRYCNSTVAPHKINKLCHSRGAVCDDNERPKGDHCHKDGKELPYHFSNVDKLVDEFLAEVRDRREIK